MTNSSKLDNSRGRITGVGGIFFKSKDKNKIKAWYHKNLGLKTDEYGSLFEFVDTDTGNKGYLQWSPMDQNTQYFQPSEKDFMINFRVLHIEKLLEQLKEAGVTVLDEIESYDYGKFVHILDPEGTKIELWEPVDEVFTNEIDNKTE